MHPVRSGAIGRGSLDVEGGWRVKSGRTKPGSGSKKPCPEHQYVRSVRPFVTAVVLQHHFFRTLLPRADRCDLQGLLILLGVLALDLCE